MSNTIKIIIVAVLALAIILVVTIKHMTSPNVVEVVDVNRSTSTNNNEKSPNSPPVTHQKEPPALIDLGAGKCIPCKLMAPILEQLKKDYAGKLRVEIMDVLENPDLTKKYSVRVIPTQIFYDASGKELFRHEGFYSREDILAKFKQLGVELEKTK
jgi:thioredoxin 1